VTPAPDDRTLVRYSYSYPPWLKKNGAEALALYRGADKSLARPGRKQAWKHVGDARDFNNIETRAVIKFFFNARQGAEGNSRHSDRTLSCFLPGRAKDLSGTPVYTLYIYIYIYIYAQECDGHLTLVSIVWYISPYHLKIETDTCTFFVSTDV